MLYSKFGEAGNVAAWPRQALDKSGPDRVDGDREHDWHGAGHRQQRHHCRGAMSQDDVGRKRGQLRRMPANLHGIGRRPPNVDPHILT